MERAPLALMTVALAVAVVLPMAVAIGQAGAGEPELCARMTPGRMLENPALAEEWARALRSNNPDELARLRALLAEIRAAHGCPGELAGPTPRPHGNALPPGHPPIAPDGDLPAGHPPVPSGPRMPLFEPPAVLTI